MNKIEPGHTIFFMGDHTSPDDPGYVRVLGDVLARFHPQLRLNLVSAGSRGQSAHGLNSRQLLDMLTQSKPDWLALCLGMSDAMRELAVRQAVDAYYRRMAAREETAEDSLGPEYRVSRADLGPISDIGREPEPQLERLASFSADLGSACAELGGAGVRLVLITPVVVGKDPLHPLNVALKAYSKAVGEVAKAQGATLVDAQRAFRDVLDRASSYKQSVALAGVGGDLNPQGQALLARTFLQTMGLLPYPGFRPPR